MMVAMMVVRKLKVLLMVLVNAVKRCFCCFRKRRGSDDALPVALTIRGSGGSSAATAEGWDEWDGPSSVVCDGGGGRKMSPVELQIHEYRQQQQRRVAELQQAPVQEHEPNLFEDLAPSLPRKPQVVIYARPDDDTNGLSNRQGLTVSDALMQVGGDLGEWDEEGGEGQWDMGGEGVDPDQVDQILLQQRQQQRQLQRLAREERKQLRLQREQQSKEGRGKIATKLS